jgi:hypothetical protein
MDHARIAWGKAPKDANRDMIYDGTLTNFDKSMGGNESSIIEIALA